MKKKLLFLVPIICLFTGSLFAQPPSGGTGAWDDPYLISTVADIEWLSATPSVWMGYSYFVQTADIDATGATITPIGTDDLNYFEGEYNGGGFNIDNLTITDGGTALYTGLFGYTNYAYISELELTNVNISGGQYVGGLVGYGIYSTIFHCGVSGTVSGTGSDNGGLAGNGVGGFMGMAFGSYISESWATVTTTSTADGSNAGGFLGSAADYAGTYDCYATGDATTAATGASYAGGFIGNMQNCDLYTSYSSGSATNGTSGGFIGYTLNGSVNSCYSNSSNALGIGNNDTGNTIVSLTELTTIEMQDPVNFPGLDFINIWADGGTNNSGFPVLQMQHFPVPPADLLAPSDLAFTNIIERSLDISWTDTNTEETGYVVEKSLDDITYTVIANLPANTETTSFTGLSNGTNYFKVYGISGVPAVPGPSVTGSLDVVLQPEITPFSYPFNAPAGTLWPSPPNGPLNIELIGANQNNATSGLVSLTNPFYFAGQSYNQFSVNENGLMTLGNTALTGTESSNAMAASIPGIKIAPYWDDLITPAGGSVSYYEYFGTTYIIWDVSLPGGTTPTIRFEVRLSGAGSISFHYGINPNAVPANPNGYSIGIGNSNTSTDFASVTVTSPTTATCAYGTANDANTLSISSGKYYTFYPDQTAPTISAGTIPITTGTGDRTITKTIADAGTGVQTSSGLEPRIYYKKNTDGNWVSTPGVLTSGNSASGTWDFTVVHSLVGGVVPGDKIYYYFIAQDQSTFMAPNIAFLPTNTGVAADDVNTVTVPPTTPYMYYIPLDLTGTMTVGTGGNFESLTNAGGLFDQINGGQLSGNLTINIISDLTETGIVALNKWVSDAGGPYTITINPSGARTINISPNGIRLSGPDGITIDGLNDGTNTLTILGGIKLYYGASNNTITRLTLSGSGINSTDASGTFPVNCSNNTISECIIDGGNIYFGSWVSTLGVNNKIENNIIRNFGMRGIHLDRGYKDFTISGNDIYQSPGPGSYTTGIDIYLPSSGGITNIFNNKIHDLRSGTSLGQTTSGIAYSGGVGTLNIYNNEISLEATTTNTEADKIYGMVIGGSGTSNIYYNSIYIGGTGVTKGNSVGFYRTNGTVNFKNNAVYNARSGAVVSQYYKNYGVVTANLTGFVSDYNLIYADGTNSVLFNIGGQPGYAAGTDYATLAAWQTASGQDANSVSANPGFTLPTNLFPTNTALNAGTPIAGITTDITGLTRDATNPTMGAYEIPCTNPTTGGSIAAPATTAGCDPFDPAVITSDGLPSGNLGTLEYQWQQSTTGEMGVYTAVGDASNSESYDPGPLTVTTWFKRLARVDCKGTWTGAAASNAVMMTVYPLPTVTTANTATICSGSSPAIALTATVPSTFTWTVGTITGGVTGASAGSGSTIDQVLTKLGTGPGTVEYIVTPTSVTGTCTGEAYTITVTVNPITPVSVTVFVFSNPVCEGTTVYFFATPTNGGTSPSFQWKVNDTIVGINANNYAYIPANGDVVTCELTPGIDIICPSNNPAISNSVIMAVLNASVTIAPDVNPVCAGTEVTFTPTPTNGGTTPTYKWFVNTVLMGVNNTFAYTPANGDVVYAEMTSNALPCLMDSPATSNEVTMTVNPLLTASVTIAASANPIIAGTSVTFTPAPTNGGSAPTYEWFLNGFSMGTSDTYTFVPVNNDVVYTIMTSNATPCLAGSPATSNSVGLTVEILPTGIVSFWPLDETTGNTYVDLNGINNGTGNLSPIAVAGIVNGAQQFNGTTTKIGVPANPTFDFAAGGDFSVELWYKGSGTGTAISRYISGTIKWYISIDKYGRAAYYMYGGNIAITASSTGINITDNTWHYITVTRNGTNGQTKLYVDGSYINTMTAIFTSGFSSPTANLQIGSYINGTILNGSLDEIAVHNVELTQAEILQHYSNGLSGLGYYEPTAPLITSIAPLNGVVGQLYSYDVNASGYPAPTYSLTAFPAGMTINPSTGLIEWTPSASGNFNVTVVATNGAAPDATQSFTIAVTDPVVIPAGLVAYWKLDEASGNTYVDFTGTNNGTGNLSPIAVAGIVNGAQQFNGTTTKIGVPANPTFDFAAGGDFSVELWYKGSGTGTAISRYISGTIKWYISIDKYGRAAYYMYGGNIAITASSTGINITDNTWHYITVTRNGTNGQTKLYVDGSYINTMTAIFTSGFSSPTANLQIGSYINGTILNGSLDEIAVHNVELTQAEILQHYSNGLSGLGYYEPTAPLITSIAPLNGVVGQLYSYDVNASGYPAPTYSLTAFPAGMTINPSTGLIEWTPSASGNFNVTVVATNGAAPDATQSFTIAVTDPVVIPAGLVAYWKLDEASGNTYVDFTGTNNGTGNLSPTAVAGIVNGAQQFNGTTTKIGVPANPTFDFAAGGDFSVELWYKGSGTGTAISRYISGTIKWYISIDKYGRAAYYMYGGNIAITASSTGINITDNTWHYITVTRNGTNGQTKLYVDGSYINTMTAIFTSGFSSPTANLQIGSYINGTILNGSLDEIAVHNVELTLTEIQQHYTDGLGGFGYYENVPPIVAIPDGGDNTTGWGNELSLDKLHAYAAANHTIRIEGQVNSGAEAMLFDLQNQIVVKQTLEEGTLNIVSTIYLRPSIYILLVIDHGNKQTFKIPIRE